MAGEKEDEVVNPPSPLSRAEKQVSRQRRSDYHFPLLPRPELRPPPKPEELRPELEDEDNRGVDRVYTRAWLQF